MQVPFTLASEPHPMPPKRLGMALPRGGAPYFMRAGSGIAAFDDLGNAAI
ncbi:MAG: hypothetical protein NVSMB31_08210 [Vulcanimicrobiaceae bacterium]